jgi:ATP-dependent DNA helicase PIF1
MELTNEQKDAIKKIKRDKNIFISGQAGTGKSFLIKYIENYSKTMEKTLYLTASTGCAACLIGGTTLHSWAGVGLGQDPIKKLVRTVRRNFGCMAKWRKTDILVIDEISMISGEYLEKLNAIGKIIRCSQRPFGGIQVIAIGDFFQLPPIAKEDEEHPFCFETDTWNELFNSSHGTSLILKKNMRQTDLFFQEQLKKIRTADIDDEVNKMLWDRVKITKKINGNYGDIMPTKLLPLRKSVDKINETNLEALIQEHKLKEHNYSTEFTFMPDDIEKSFSDEEQIKVQKFVESNGQPQINLRLCVGAQVMLIHNLCIDKGLVNGSRGIIVGFDEENPCVKFLDGKSYTINFNIWNIVHDKGIVEYKQIPLRLAWAVSQHKSQGSSLDMIEVDIGPNIFEYGQTYTTLSRVRSLDGLYITRYAKDRIKSHPKVKEFYKNVKEQLENYVDKSSIERFFSRSHKP